MGDFLRLMRRIGSAPKDYPKDHSMPEMTTQVLLHMLEHGEPENSDGLARAMIAAALSYFWARRGEDATVAMMEQDIVTVRGLSAVPEACRPVGLALN